MQHSPTVRQRPFSITSRQLTKHATRRTSPYEIPFEFPFDGLSSLVNDVMNEVQSAFDDRFAFVKRSNRSFCRPTCCYCQSRCSTMLQSVIKVQLLGRYVTGSLSIASIAHWCCLDRLSGRFLPRLAYPSTATASITH